jgi:hypothetical protein
VQRAFDDAASTIRQTLDDGVAGAEEGIAGAEEGIEAGVVGAEQGVEKGVTGRRLHSSTLQLNLSRS